jgi:hypothetical protein
LFAYCAGIEDKGNVAIQLIETESSKMVWAYSVNKQKGGSKNQQSMAEAISKHFKDFLLVAPPPMPAPAQTLAPAVVIQPAPVPTALVVTRTPLPIKQVSYRRDSVQIAPLAETRLQPVRSEESPADAARHAKQRKACLELAKENPSVTCN